MASSSTSATPSASMMPPRIPFDSEAELDQVLNRLKQWLLVDLQKRWKEDIGIGRDEDGRLDKDVEQLVMDQYFEKMVPYIRENCSFDGQTYDDYKASVASQQTKPWSEVLHDRVRHYQLELFDARLANLEERKALPGLLATELAESITLTDAYLASLEALANPTFPPRPAAPTRTVVEPTSRRKSTLPAGVKEASNPTEEAAKYFADAGEMMQDLVDTLPGIIANAERATKTNEDLRKLLAPSTA